MKKITLTLAMATMVAATSMATEPTNLIQNGGAEEEMAYATVKNNEAGFPRVIEIWNEAFEASAPTPVEGITKTKGMWIRKQLTTMSYANVYAGAATGATGTKAFGIYFNDKPTGAQPSTGTFTGHMIMQEIDYTFDASKKYILTFRAAPNDNKKTDNVNYCTEICVSLNYKEARGDGQGYYMRQWADTLDVIAGGWNDYLVEFDFTKRPGGFKTEDLSFGITTKTEYTNIEGVKSGKAGGVFFDDISLVDPTATNITDTEKANAQVTGQAGSVRIVSEAGANVALYTLSGTLVSSAVLNSNEASMEAKAGMYLVKVDNTTYKTIVK